MNNAQVAIPALRIEHITLTIESDTPLLSNRFSPTKRGVIDDKAEGRPRGARPPKDPQKEYLESLYTSKEGWYGFPAGGIKGACVECAKRFVDDLHGTEAKGAFFIVPQGIEKDTGHDLVRLVGEHEMHESVVRLNGPGAPPETRYRAMFPEWSIMFGIRYNPNVITKEIIAYLLEAAGFHIGIGGWRPGAPRGNPGTFGMFHVKRS